MSIKGTRDRTVNHKAAAETIERIREYEARKRARAERDAKKKETK